MWSWIRVINLYWMLFMFSSKQTKRFGLALSCLYTPAYHETCLSVGWRGDRALQLAGKQVSCVGVKDRWMADVWVSNEVGSPMPPTESVTYIGDTKDIIERMIRSCSLLFELQISQTQIYMYIYMYISFLIHAIWSIYKIHSKERAHDLRFVVCWALVWFGASRFHPMMTPSNVMWGESIGHRRIPLTKANNTELWCFSLKSSWTNGWANSRDAGDLTHHGAHYDITVMQSYVWSSGSAATLCTLLSNCLYVHKRVILVFIALFGSQLGK